MPLSTIYIPDPFDSPSPLFSYYPTVKVFSLKDRIIRQNLQIRTFALLLAPFSLLFLYLSPITLPFPFLLMLSRLSLHTLTFRRPASYPAVIIRIGQGSIIGERKVAVGGTVRELVLVAIGDERSIRRRRSGRPGLGQVGNGAVQVLQEEA